MKKHVTKPADPFMTIFPGHTTTKAQTTDSNLKNLLPTMSTELNIGMDFQPGHVPANNSEVRGGNPLSSTITSREPSMVSSGRATPYHDRMDIEVDDVPPSNHTSNHHLELSYKTEQEKALRWGKATNLPDNMRPPTTNNEATPAYVAHEEDVINIQLLYDPNAPTEPELWSGAFHPISLHGSIEHFASDAKNIKVSLNFSAKYIQGKQVNGIKINDLGDFDGMGDVIWNFISAVYAS